MRVLVVVAAMLLAGCFIVPQTDTTVTTSSQGVVTARGTPGPVSLAVAASATVATVTASQAYICRDDLRVVTEQRTHKHAHLYAVNGSGNVVYVWIFFAPVTIPISGLFTLLDLASSGGDDVTDTPSTSPGAPYACTAPAANLAIELVTGDGGVIARGTTDVRGSVAFPLPPDLPGDAIVRAPAIGQIARVR
jgi:hypothetical protein|nr:hypothetical protein [Kofleriaceae bacterium]